MTYRPPTRAEKFGALPSLLLTAAALLAIAGLGAVVLTQDAAASAPVAPVAEPAAGVTVGQSMDVPAAAVIAAVMGEAHLTWAARPPVPFACTPPSFALSATAATAEGTLGLHVTTAGGGRAALDDLAGCGRSRPVAGAPGVRLAFDGGSAIVWQRGDVLVSLAAAEPSEAALAAVDARVLAALTPVCTSLEVAASDATRNPANPAYAQYSQPAEVSIAPSPADPGAPEAIPALTELTSVVMPASLTGPALPAPVVKPSPPTFPGAQVTSTTVQVPVIDATGPGCGWAFTAMTAPVVDAEAISTQAQSVRSEALQALLAQQLEWNTAVTLYSAELATFTSAAAAWNTYVASAQSVQAQWTEQRRVLSVYAQEKADYDAAVLGRDTLLAQQAAAQGEYDALVAKCAAVQPPPVVSDPAAAPTAPPSTPPTTVAPPEPAITCPAVRPLVLDAAVPVLGAAPVPPTLWSATG